MHLLEHLEAAAQANRGRIICYDAGNVKKSTSHTYPELLKTARESAQTLQSLDGFRPGKVVLIHFTSHWENIVWLWASLIAGGIPAMSTAVSQNASRRVAHLEHLARTLFSPVCVTTAALFTDFGGQDAIRPIAVESMKSAQDGGALNSTLSNGASVTEDIPSSAGAAVLMLTSGSSGFPKATSLTHDQITAAIRGKLGVIHLPETTAMMNWIALDHVAGLIEIHISAMYDHRDQIHVQPVDLLARPVTFLDLIERHRVSRTFAPNFFLTKLRDALADPHLQDGPWDLECLRYVASGGEPNVTRTCAELSAQLHRYGTPKNVIVPGFGMTETCAGAIFNTECPEYDLQNGLEMTAVGHCMPGIQMRINGDDGSNIPLPPNQVGNLELTGPVVFSGYFNNPVATMEAFTSDGWFRTGDKGSLDVTGSLALVGRSKETMIVNGVKYHPADIESILNESKILGMLPSFACCFSSFPKEGSRGTEEVCLVYLPTYAPEDMKARAKTAEAISRVILMSTSLQLRILPLGPGQLQKSSLGKLSRSQIKTAYERGEYHGFQSINDEVLQLYRKITRETPKDEFEARLLDTFVQSLGLSKETFDVKTPIFDMGITSIELIKLKKNLEEHLDLAQEIPMITLMTKTTVRELGQALRSLQPGAKAAEYSPVVTLQSPEGKTKTPLWLVHPGVGEVLVFLNLSKFLADRPVYALRARGFNEGEKPFTTVSEVVDTYYHSVKATQPHGPYALAGYSYGSMLAFEVGKRLEANGDQVSFLGSFNLPPHIKTRMRQLDWTSCLLHLSYFLELMSEARSHELMTELKGIDTREDIVARVLENASSERLAELALSPMALMKWATLAFALQSMAIDYEPQGSIQGMDIFYCHPLAIVASSKEQWKQDHLEKWEDFARSKPRFHDVGGSHYTMLGPEHVFDFQRTLRKALEQRGI